MASGTFAADLDAAYVAAPASSGVGEDDSSLRAAVAVLRRQLAD